MTTTIGPVRRMLGEPEIPGDKSISHRMLMFGALAHGTTRVTHLLDAADVRSTRAILERLGVRIEDDGDAVLVHGAGPGAFVAPAATLDCGNSGTTMRLLAGMLAGRPFASTLDGDESLRARPMGRVAEPLRRFGARLELAAGDRAPLRIAGGALHAARYDLPIASAQVKSALLLAALDAEGETVLGGELGGRDHTERLLRHFGVRLETGAEIRIRGGQALRAADLRVPGDPSSAAFWIAAASIVPGSHVVMRDVGVNPTRAGFITVMRRMGANVRVEDVRDAAEPTATIVAEYARLTATEIAGDEIPGLIDELPLIAMLAAYAHGTTVVRDARELRVKESDRIEAIATNLRALGARIDVRADGFAIAGPQRLHGTAAARSFGDHRIAMATAIAALGASGPVTIDDAGCVGISYPRFFPTLRMLTEPPRNAGVLGASLGASRSSAIFAWLARETVTNVAYRPIERPPTEVAALFASLRADPQGVGFNVTIPYKATAFALVDRHAPVAAATGAVNVVARAADGSLEGHNTDVAGILTTFDRRAIAVRGRRVCVLGAGGAAAAAVYALVQREPAAIDVVNRTAANAERLVARFATDAPAGMLRAVAEPAGAYALVVDTTPGTGVVPAIEADGWAFDVKYGAMATPFLTAARGRGVKTVDGLEMLVAQALATFEIWFRAGHALEPTEHARLMRGLLDHLGGER